MTKWKVDDIAAEQRAKVDDATAGWTDEQFRSKLAEILAATVPVRLTLSGLVDNPYNEGQVVTSGLFPEQFAEDRDIDEPWGAVFNSETRGWDYVHYGWGEPLPKGLELQEARFDRGVTLHDDTPILSVWHYHTACSIFAGSFDATDVNRLVAACQLGVQNA